MRIQEGERLGRYLLEELLVRNARTLVYLASHGEPGVREWCVLRVVSPQARKTGFVDAFMADARTASELSHPNLAAVFDVGLLEGISFSAMEHIRGVDLLTVFGKAKRTRVPIPVDIVLWIAHETCSGLQYLHELEGHDGNARGLVHRNIGLSNLMISDSGLVKVLDLGVSGAKAPPEIMDSRATPAVRVDYAAPEMLREESLDGRSDLFSLGVVMHELLTGHRLFHRDGQIARSSDGVEEVRRPSSIRRDLPKEVDEIVMCALEMEREQRYPSAAHMKRAVASLLEGEKESGNQVLAGYVTDGFADLLAEVEEKKARVSSGAVCLEKSATGARAAGDSRAESSHDDSEKKKLSSGDEKKPGGQDEEKRRSPSAKTLLGVFAILVVLGGGAWFAWHETQRAPYWSLEAWQESLGGKMAEPIPFAPKKEASVAKSKARAKASRLDPKQSEIGDTEEMTGQLMVVCPASCTIYVDGEQARSDGPFTLPIGDRDLRVVDDATGREMSTRVLIAPGRVHVQDVEFPPRFRERTGMEEW